MTIDESIGNDFKDKAFNGRVTGDDVANLLGIGREYRRAKRDVEIGASGLGESKKADKRIASAYRYMMECR